MPDPIEGPSRAGDTGDSRSERMRIFAHGCGVVAGCGLTISRAASTAGLMASLMASLMAGLVAGSTGCDAASGRAPGEGIGIILPGQDDGGEDGGDADAAEAPPPARVQLRRLTRAQYGASIQDLLGTQIELPTAIEPDLVVDLYTTIGATQAVLSELGAEQLETAARDLAEQVVDDPAIRAHVIGCEPSAPDCAGQFIASVGRQAFRRPLTADEQARYEGLFSSMQGLHGDPWEGVQGVLTAMLSSPHFVYVVELGEPDPGDEARLRFSSLEMASRLSLALWASGPDEVLLAAGEAGELVEPEAIEAQVERMLADPRARRGLGRFFAEWLGLDVLDGLSKETALFPQASPELFASMRGQMERMVEDAAFEGGSLQALVAGRRTFVDARLAALYGVAAPTEVDAEGFGEIELPQDGQRTGILGTGAFLATQSRRTRTSPTLRGVWVQARLRCHELPPPPPDVETDLPDGTDDSEMTLRELLEQHRENPTCAGCHAQVDPIGLALESYDALGAFRTTDRGQPIDTSVDLDGVALDGLSDLAEHIADDPAFATCVVKQLYRYTTGHHEAPEEMPAIEALAGALVDAEFSLPAFLPRLMSSPQFRTLAIPE
ncbi:DUF1592 domain-containing protein [Paraliomyxa miuraensis]|uniref:DUF1592 domain-containing protein n=1 Tax=Paraliomyxa miuraensis TaxID=376150 RepID=UPI00224F9A9A|nr:DUF1592 domain-containing protein [Paraliomyxa miuraensis]MCX4242451.1 DUF1592 domain-containing protein [Paraliomyxa miuraensis]